MIATTRRWFRRNRTNLVVGAGVIGAGYVAGQYVLGKISEARERMNEDRVAKENLRRRFEQNQEDCAYTVLALLPTIREEVIGALPVEQITEQLQQERQERLKKLGQSDAASSELPSGPPSVADDASSGSFVHASQMASSTSEGGLRPKRSKAQLWQDMKINSVTRALTLLYTLSLLTILTRIQLNLLGRRTYLSSVVSLASPPNATQSSTISLENRDDDNYDNVYGNDFETNRKYLTYSWWLLHRGSRQIMDRVTAAVKEVFGAVNIREDVSIERLADLIMQVRKKIEGATEEDRRQMRWLAYLLPPKEQELFVMRQAGSSDSGESPSPDSEAKQDPMSTDGGITPALRKLLDETSDLTDSPTFSLVLTKLLDAGFSHLVDYRIATEAYDTPATGMEPSMARVTEIPDVKRKIAHILPVFCRQAHAMVVGSGELDALAGVASQEGLGNEYLGAINRVGDLEAFAAVIYSSNFGFEFAEGAAAGRAARMAEPDIPTPGEAEAGLQSTQPERVDCPVVGGEDMAQPAAVAGTDAEASPAGGFESAWKKALAAEDSVDTAKDGRGETSG